MRIQLGASLATSIASATGWIAVFEGGERRPVICWALAGDELHPLVLEGSRLRSASDIGYFQRLEPPKRGIDVTTL